MDMNWNDREALSVGAFYRSHSDTSWRSMDSAPRDGTYVELKCSYGVAPWYCIARWTNEQVAHGSNGVLRSFTGDRPSWVKPEGGGPFNESSLEWRPFHGDIRSYSDPTCGLQNSAAYWRGAVAAKYGLPLDHFEKGETRRAETPKRSKPGFFERLFSWSGELED